MEEIVDIDHREQTCVHVVDIALRFSPIAKPHAKHVIHDPRHSNRTLSNRLSSDGLRVFRYFNGFFYPRLRVFRHFDGFFYPRLRVFQTIAGLFGCALRVFQTIIGFCVGGLRVFRSLHRRFRPAFAGGRQRFPQALNHRLQQLRVLVDGARQRRHLDVLLRLQTRRSGLRGRRTRSLSQGNRRCDLQTRRAEPMDLLQLRILRGDGAVLREQTAIGGEERSGKPAFGESDWNQRTAKIAHRNRRSFCTADSPSRATLCSASACG